MIEQLFFKNAGGEIKFDDVPQEIMCRAEDRCGGYVGNLGPGTLVVFMGDVVKLEPWHAVSLGDYQGPVKITGKYTNRFQAVEFIKDPGK